MWNIYFIYYTKILSDIYIYIISDYIYFISHLNIFYRSLIVCYMHTYNPNSHVVKSTCCKHMKLQKRGKSVPRMKLQRQIPEAVPSPPCMLKDGMLFALIG